MAAPADTEHESARRALARHKAAAGAMLFAAGAGFVASSLVVAPTPAIDLARAACEAGLVGGLADWFAVTALFRHPLGLPIPHTAIIPRQKDRIGAALGRFVAHHFLAPEVVAAKLAASDPAASLARWLIDRDHADLVANRIAAALPRLAAAAGDRDVRRFLREAIVSRLAAFDMREASARIVESFVADGHHLRLIDESLRALTGWLDDHHDAIMQEVQGQTAWYVPGFVDRAIAARLIDGLRRYLDEAADLGHPTRLKLNLAAQGYLDRMRHDPAFAARIADWRDRLLRQPETLAWLEQSFDHLRDSLDADLARPDSAVRAAIAQAVRAVADGLATDASLRTGVNATIARVVLSVVVPAREEIGRFIAEVVRGWKAAELTERAELAVGRDLQYIRINGTLVGAAIGAALWGLHRLLAG